MRNDILKEVSVDLLSSIPIISRAIRKRVADFSFPEDNIDIKLQQFEILRLLGEEGTLNISQIAKRLYIQKAQMTKLIDKLVVFDLIEQKIGKSDRRTHEITLTSKARIILEKQKRNTERRMREIMSGLTSEDLKNLKISLRNLHHIFNKQS